MSSLMPGAEPFLFRKGPTGCLLVHGLTGTPYEMRPLGEALARNGVTVLGIRLPGHGTRPEDLAGVSWEDWADEVSRGYRRLRSYCGRVFVGGLSMGGSLVLHLAAHERPDGVICLSAPAHPGFFRDIRLKILPVWKYVQQWGPRLGGDIREKGRTVCYDKTHINGILEMLKLVRRVKLEVPDITAPILLMQSRQDHTVPTENMDWIYRTVGSSRREQLWLQRSYHVITLDVEREVVCRKTVQFIKSVAGNKAKG